MFIQPGIRPVKGIRQPVAKPKQAPLPTTAGDLFTIRFGAAPVDPELQDLRNRVGAKLGVNRLPVTEGDLRKAFVTEYYTRLAKRLMDSSVDRKGFYQDVPLTEDDFFFNHLETDRDVELYELYGWGGFLGYDNPDHFDRDTAQYRKAIADKLGIRSTDDRDIIETMASMDKREIARRFNF